MRVVCVYRDNEDYTRSVTEWIENMRRQTGYGAVRNAWRGRTLPLLNEVLYYLI